MIDAFRSYFRLLAQRFGEGWDRFWFTPSDPSTLSVLRVLTGMVALYWHAVLSMDIVPLFATGGLLPVETVREIEGPQGAFSYLFALGTPGELWMAQVLGLVAILLFTVGAATRVSSVLALLVVVSDVNRAPMLSSQLEPVLIMVMLYLCIGPSGRYLSIDSLLRRRVAVDKRLSAPAGSTLSTAATIAIRLMQVHLAMLYAAMGLSKLMTDSWWNGLSMWWLITRTETRLLDLTGLYAYPFVLNFWTHAVVAFQLLFPILIWNRTARPLLLALAALLWLSLAPVIGQLGFIAMILVANMAFIPPEIMRSFCSRCFAGENREPVTINHPRPAQGG